VRTKQDYQELVRRTTCD